MEKNIFGRVFPRFTWDLILETFWASHVEITGGFQKIMEHMNMEMIQINPHSPHVTNETMCWNNARWLHRILPDKKCKWELSMVLIET